jgi:hypothetical protein
MSKIIIPIILFLLISCEKKETNANRDVRSMNEPDVPIDVLIDSVENYGSVHAYELLEIASLDYRSGEFLSTFMIMADKYNNSSASMSVYYQLIRMYDAKLIEDSENGIYDLE